MKSVIYLSLCFAFSEALVCTPQLCTMMKNAAPIQCKGSVIKGGGFCGCTDSCAKQEGESCQLPTASVLFGMIPAGSCDDGLECTPPTDNAVMLRGTGRCNQKSKVLPKTREIHLTKCQQERRVRMISMVVWQGMWTPKCDYLGKYEPQQCDNTGHCFCVTSETGEVIQRSKVLGAAQCSKQYQPASLGPMSVAPEVSLSQRSSLTKCKRVYQAYMFSFVTWQGKWDPKCDAQGNYQPKQCDNINQCFCVTPLTGTVLEQSKVHSQDIDCSKFDLTEPPTTTTTMQSLLLS